MRMRGAQVRRKAISVCLAILACCLSLPLASSQTGAEGEVRAVLEQWRDSFMRRNVQQNVSFYAPSLTRYLTWERAPQARVRMDKQHTFSQIKAVRQYDLSNIHVQMESPTQAYVTFTRKYQFDLPNGQASSGEEQDGVRLAKLGTDWKITSEQQLKVLSHNTSQAETEAAAAPETNTRPAKQKQPEPTVTEIAPGTPAAKSQATEAQPPAVAPPAPKPEEEKAPAITGDTEAASAPPAAAPPASAGSATPTQSTTANPPAPATDNAPPAASAPASSTQASTPPPPQTAPPQAAPQPMQSSADSPSTGLSGAALATEFFKEHAQMMVFVIATLLCCIVLLISFRVAARKS